MAERNATQHAVWQLAKKIQTDITWREAREMMAGHEASYPKRKLTAIKSAMEGLGYVHTQRTGGGTLFAHIGVVLPYLDSSHHVEICHKIIELARQRYHVMVEVTENNPEYEQRAVMMFKRTNVAGVVITSSLFHMSNIQELEKDGIITVCIRGLPDDKEMPKRTAGFSNPIYVDHETGSFNAVLHLVDQGHRKIAFVEGPSNSDSNRAKKHGYIRGLVSTGLLKDEDDHSLDDLVIRPTQDFSFEGGRQVCKALLSNTMHRPSALMCYNDELAVGAMWAAADIGYKVPRDLSIIGHDGIKLGQMVTPRLTTIAINHEELARESLNIISARGDYLPDKPIRPLFTPYDSTATPAPRE